MALRATHAVRARRPEPQRRGWALSIAASVLLTMGCSGSGVTGQVAAKPIAAPAVSSSPLPVAPPAAQGLAAGPALLPEVLSHGSRTRRSVALTFDSNLTRYMEHELDDHRVASFDDVAAVDELIRLRVPATFFLSGLWMERYPAETRRLARVPFFELASHSYIHRGYTRHCYGLGSLTPGQMAPDIEQSERVLHHFDPGATDLFRFPGGCYDRTALAAAKAARVQVVQYDVASGDAFGSSVRRIVSHTLNSVRSGSIVVLHITGGNTAPLTPQALPQIVAGLRARGYTLMTVSQLAAESAAA